MVHKKFPMFNLLPSELRQLVYSRMLLKDRVAVALASSEALEYFTRERNRVEVAPVIVFAADVRGQTTIVVIYGDNYMELFVFSPECATQLRIELDSYRDCPCFRCLCWKKYITLVHRNIDCKASTDKKRRRKIPTRTTTWTSMRQVVFALRLVEADSIEIRTAPYGGLLEAMCPPAPLCAKTNLCVFWHNPDDRQPSAHLKVQMWNRWLGVTRSVQIQTSTRNERVHQDVLLLNTVIGASDVGVSGTTTISFAQLNALEARSAWLDCASLLDGDVIHYFVEKLKRWIQNPREHFCVRLPGNEFRLEKLLEQVAEQIALPVYKFYPNYFYGQKRTVPLQANPVNRVTIRNLETNTALYVASSYMLTLGVHERLCDDVWP